MENSAVSLEELLIGLGIALALRAAASLFGLDGGEDGEDGGGDGGGGD